MNSNDARITRQTAATQELDCNEVGASPQTAENEPPDSAERIAQKIDSVDNVSGNLAAKARAYRDRWRARIAVAEQLAAAPPELNLMRRVVVASRRGCAVCEGTSEPGECMVCCFRAAFAEAQLGAAVRADRIGIYIVPCTKCLHTRCGSACDCDCQVTP